LLNKIKITSLFVLLFSLAAIFFVAKMSAQNDKKKTAEQEFKNIQVLKEMPAEDSPKVIRLRNRIVDGTARRT
jgi:hypothetical protein